MSKITFDLNAKISGYEASLKQLKDAIAKIDLGSEIGKNISEALKVAESQVKTLSKNLTPQATSNTQIDNIVEKVNKTGESIQSLASLIQKINSEDLNLDALDSEVKQVIQDISALQKQMDQSISGGLKDFLNSDAKGAADLKEVFKSLGVEVDNINEKTAKNALAKGLEEATKAAENAQEALDKVNAALEAQKNSFKDKFGGNPFANENFNETDYISRVSAIKAPDKILDPQKIEALKQQMLQGLSNLKLDEKSDLAINLLDSFFSGLTPENIHQKLNIFTKEVNKELGISKQDITAQLLNGQSNNNFVNALLGIDEEKVTEAKNSLLQMLEEISSGLKPEQVASIKTLIDQGRIDDAKNKTLEAMRRAYEAIKREMKEENDEIAQLTKQQDVATQNKDSADARVQTLTNAQSVYDKQIESLQATVNAQQEKIDNLTTKLNALLENRTSQVRTDSGVAGNGVQNLKITREEAAKYKTELEQVQAREKLIGKIEGVVQRWFSIYAAVRMVSNAIKSVISTVKELDKTITEIAIVTDMTQDDLWKQMSDYTDMATQYAASISGVYKVSQLYYQQGLQTADVMALTEETLKMARISGLDYAEATNYMTNAVRSFKMEMTDAQRVVDVYSAIAASSATSTAELASAMSKTASSAQAVGSSFENTTAMMAVMIEATRESAENIGSALKSIISRYGEMKEDPAKLIDSEGEEMSLNKVDKALKSVGISLQDTNHQFRDFDDVITELAGKWDTIDTNTQRYIATIMAGNRQQSRFLALVSSGERLTELSEKAANSQDTATLQMLKTMDSIEAKSQQLTTSLQSLYTSSGVQNLFKDFLDIGNQIVKTFTQMPTILNLPIPAILKIGTTFASLANVVTTIFGLMKLKIQTQIKALTAQEQSESTKRVSIKQQEATERILLAEEEEMAMASLYQQDKINYETFEREKTRIKAEQEKARKDLERNGGLLRADAAKSLGLNMAGIALSTISGAISDKTRGGQIAKGLTGIAGSAASMAGMGMMFGPHGAAIGAALGGVMGIVENINFLFESAENKANRLKEAAENAKNNYLQQNAEAKDLQEQIDKLKELEKTQNESAEAKAEFLELSNSIASSNPELVGAYDNEGNAIISLTASYRELAKARGEASEALDESIKTSMAAAQNAIDVAEKNRYKQINKTFEENSSRNYNNGKEDKYGYSFANNGLAADFYSSELIFKDLEGIDKEVQYQISELLTNLANGNWTTVDLQLKDKNVQKGLNLLNEKAGVLGETVYQLVSDYTAGIVDVDRKIAEKKNSYNTLERSNLLNKINDTNTEKQGTENEVLLNSFSEAGILIDNYILSHFEKWKDELPKTEEGDIIYDNSYGSALEQFLAEEYNTLYNNIYTSLENFWSNGLITEAKQNEIINVLNNRKNYTQDQLKETIASILNIEIDKLDKNLVDAIDGYYKDSFDTEDFNKKIVETASKQNKRSGDFLRIRTPSGNLTDQLGESELTKIFEIYTTLDQGITNKTFSIGQGQKILNSYLKIWDATTLLDDSSREIAQGLIGSMDDLSLDNIKELKTSVSELDLPEEQKQLILNSLDELLNLVPVNLNTEINTFVESISSGMGDFEAALSKATKGMNYKDAAEIAAKMGVSVTSFKQVGTKFFIDDLEKLKEAYIKVDNELLTTIEGRINNISTALTNAFEGKELTEESFNDEDLKEKITKALEDEGANITADQLNLEEYWKEWSALDKETRGSFEQYVVDSWLKVLDEAKEADNFVNTQMAENYLANGDFSNFLDYLQKAGTISEEQVGNYQQYFDEGNFDQLLLIFPQYADTIVKTFKDIGTGLLNRITSASSYDNYVSVDSTNASEIQKLVDAGLASYIYDSNGEITGAKLVELTEENIDEFNKAVNNLPLTSSEKAKSAADATKSLYEDSLDKIVDDITKNSKSVSAETAELMRQQLITTFGEKSGNKKFDQLFKDNGNGTYEANIGSLKTILAGLWYDLNVKTRESAETAVQKTADDLIKEISTATSLLTKGTDSNSDKQTFVDRFKELTGKTISIDTAFNYNELLGTDTLDYSIYQEYIQADARALGEAKGLADEELDNFIEEYLARQGKNFVKEVDIKSFLSAEKKDEGSKAYQTLVSQMKNFYVSTEKTKEEAQEEISKSIGNIVQGGQAAVDELLAWAEKSGEEVSEEDVAAVYRYGMDDIENAFEQLSYNVGSIVSGQAKEIIQGLTDAGWELEEIEGTDSAVIKAVGDVADAYLAYYNKLVTSEKATVAALNGAMAMVLETREDSDIIDALGDAASMTYSQLGEILATKGIELTEDFVEQYSDAIQSIGGGKIRITNFDKFATEIMGWTDIDTSSEEYISAFKTYNDSLIDMNRKAERNIIEEVQSLENVKGGDWINLTQLYSELTKELVPEGYKGNVDLKHRPIVDFGEYYETILGTSRMDIDFSEIEGELPKIGITLASITKDGIELTEDYIDEYSVNLFDKAKEIQASGDTRALSEIIKEVDASMDNLLLDAIDGYGETAEELSQTLDSNAEELHNRQAEWYGMLRALNNAGATIEDGILKIDEENANIPAIMNILIDSIQNSGKLATQEEAQLLDTLNDNLKQYSDLISNGIKGNLNYQGAQQLKDWAKASGIGDLDFQKTAEGLKLSEQSAFKLYTILKDVDILQSSLTLEELADSLEETNENYRDIPSIMAHIAELEREIDNPDISTERREEYERELSVAKEIAQTRSMTDKGNFNFMDNDLPDAIKNVKDFWQGTYDGFESMNKAIDKGYMSIEDFYNLANFMNDTAKITGQSVSFFGTEVGGSLDSLSSLLQKGFGAINNIDTEGPMVNLKAFGANFKTGASEMKKDYITGVKEMAKGQIKVLDAMIAQLELVVAMEKLKPVDINNDNKISLDELFILKTDENGNIIGIDGLTKQGKDALQAILDASETNKDLANALDTFEINGKSMREWMEAAIKGEIKSVDDAKVFQATLSAFYAALQTGDWSPESIKTNIIKFLQESLDKGTWAEFTLTDGTKVQVSHEGYIEEKDGKWYSNGNGKSYDTIEEARDAVRFEAETGIKNAFRNENGEMQGSINIDDEHKVTVTEGINGEYKYSYKGASGETSGTKEEAIQAAYQDYHDQAIKNNDLPGANTDLEQWMIDHDIVTKFNLTITDVQATTNKTVGELSDEMLADLGIDVGLVTAVQAGIERAFLDGQGIIGNAIATGITTALSSFTPSPQQAQNFNLPNVNAKIKNLSIVDVENITFGQTLTGNPFTDFIGGIVNKLFGNDGLAINELKAKVTNLILEKPTNTNFSAVEEGQSNASIDTVKASVSKLELSKPTTTDFTAVEEGQDNVNLGTVHAGVEKLEISKPTEIDDTAVVEAATTTGKNINTGLVEGMKDTAEVRKQALEVGNSVTNAINVAAGTHSPSTITTKTGKDLVEGLVNGLSDSSSAVSAATTVAEQIINAIQTYFNEHPIIINTSVGSSDSNNENSDDSGLVAIQTAIDNISKAANTATTSINTLNEKLEAISENGATKAEDFEKALSAIGDNGKNKADDFQSALEAIGDNGKEKADDFQDALSNIGDNGKEKADDFQDALSNIGDNGKNKADDFAAALDDIKQDGVNKAEDFQGAVNGISSTGVTNASNFKDAVNDTGSSGANNASAYRYAVNGTYESGATHAKNFKDALNSINQTTLHVNVKVTTSGASAQVSGNLNPWWSWAKGNVSSNNSNIALAGGKTLMGELGPELVVSKGRYFLVGQNGPEMVDLDNDAIVFNHLQTEKLIKNGKVNTHGQPVTNEKNATSMASGNFTGPAFASASETLALLKELREMWKSLLKASAKQLGSEAGRDTGSSGSGSTPHSTDTKDRSDKASIKANVKEIQRWYNLLRQIENLEQKITYQETLRDKLNSDRKSNGKAVYESYKQELALLDKQIAASKELATLQKKRYDDRREDLENSWYGKMLYTYDEDGLQQYRSGNNRGLDLLTKLTQTDANGAPTGAAKNAKSQLAYLQKQGMNLNDLLVKGDGSRIADEVRSDGTIWKDGQQLKGQDLQNAREEMMQVFWDNVDGWRDEMDNLYDSYHDQEEAVLEEEKKRNEIMQAFVDNQLSLEQTILQAVEDMKQNEIDKLQSERDAYEEAVTNFIAGLNESLDKERSMYESEQNSNELEKMQRQLALLQRTGGSGAQVRSLQEQIDTKQQDIYFDERQAEIDAIQTASDNEIAKLDQQIDIMSQTLEYQKEHGLLWDQVYDVMGRSEAEIKDFVLKNGSEWASKSSLQIDEDLRALSSTVEMYVARREDAEKGKDPLDDKDPKAKKDWGEEERTGEKKEATGSPEGSEQQEEKKPKPKKKKDEIEDIPEVTDIEPLPKNPDITIQTDLPTNLDEGELLDLSTKVPEPVKKPTKQPVEKPTKHTVEEPTKQPTYITTGLIGGKTMDLEELKKLIAAGKVTPGKGFGKFFSFKKGGIADFTGPAWLDGTKTKPETVLNAEQTKALREKLISNKKAHEAMVKSAEITKDNISNATNYNTNESSITIENIDFDMNVSKIANDMDAKAAGEKALDEMVRIARKSGNRSLARR